MRKFIKASIVALCVMGFLLALTCLVFTCGREVTPSLEGHKLEILDVYAENGKYVAKMFNSECIVMNGEPTAVFRKAQHVIVLHYSMTTTMGDTIEPTRYYDRAIKRGQPIPEAFPIEKVDAVQFLNGNGVLKTANVRSVE